MRQLFLIFSAMALLLGTGLAQPTVNTKTGDVPTVNNGPRPRTTSAQIDLQTMNVVVGKPKDAKGYYFGRSVEVPDVLLSVRSPSKELTEGTKLTLMRVDAKTYRCTLGSDVVYVYLLD